MYLRGKNTFGGKSTRVYSLSFELACIGATVDFFSHA